MNGSRFKLLGSCVCFFDFAVVKIHILIFFCVSVSFSLILDRKVTLLELCDEMPGIGLSALLQLVISY